MTNSTGNITIIAGNGLQWLETWRRILSKKSQNAEEIRRLLINSPEDSSIPEWLAGE